MPIDSIHWPHLSVSLFLSFSLAFIHIFHIQIWYSFLLVFIITQFILYAYKRIKFIFFQVFFFDFSFRIFVNQWLACENKWSSRVSYLNMSCLKVHSYWFNICVLKWERYEFVLFLIRSAIWYEVWVWYETLRVTNAGQQQFVVCPIPLCQAASKVVTWQHVWLLDVLCFTWAADFVSHTQHRSSNKTTEYVS